MATIPFLGREPEGAELRSVVAAHGEGPEGAWVGAYAWWACGGREAITRRQVTSEADVRTAKTGLSFAAARALAEHTDTDLRTAGRLTVCHDAWMAALVLDALEAIAEGIHMMAPVPRVDLASTAEGQRLEPLAPRGVAPVRHVTRGSGTGASASRRCTRGGHSTA